MRLRAYFLSLVITLLLFVWSGRASAYPWMIRHDYAGCATCHVDPSGSGVLTPYGRAQSELLLSTKWKKVAAEEEEPSRFSEFLFGAFKSPDELQMQGWIRNGYMLNDVGGASDNRFLQMRADLGAHVAVGAFRAAATVGWNRQESAPYSQEAWINGASSSGNVVSREHWLGASLGEGTWLLRAGRMNVPFGLRNPEHISWVRSATHTDTNQNQEHGVAIAYTSDKLRGELMAIAGNFQLRPDAYRERGYAAYGEILAAERIAVGLSSLVGHADADIATRSAVTRQAHGLFARLAPWQPLTLLAEADLLVTSLKGFGTNVGHVEMLQADYEPIQGVHAILTGELLGRGGGDPTHIGVWLGAGWFPLSHFEVRIDGIRRMASGTPAATTLLAQAQLYL